MEIERKSEPTAGEERPGERSVPATVVQARSAITSPCTGRVVIARSRAPATAWKTLCTAWGTCAPH